MRRNEKYERNEIETKDEEGTEKKGLIFQHTTAVTASAPSRVNEKGKQITVSC